MMKKQAALFCTGAVGYSAIEIAARGHTHWTMTLLGGACLVGLYALASAWAARPLWLQALAGAAGITAAELAVGLVVNLGLGWQVWDYSDLPWNILGQVSLKYSALWLPVSLAGIVLDDCLRYRWFGEERPRYNLGLTRKWRWSVRL